MPRVSRRISETGIYHIMLRGIDKRDIFIKDEDYQKFINCMKKAKEKIEFTIYAYCLMTNHVHILIKTETEEIGNIIRRITVGYVQYHNTKYSRTGHLFQNRFRSETVESEKYFLVVLRYIHQNPVKAGIVNNLGHYKWSSFNEYFNNELIDSSYSLGYFNDVREFELYMQEENEDECLEHNLRRRYTDEKLREVISEFIEVDKLYKLDIKYRNEVIRRIREHTGASNRQLARVLNIGRGVLDRIMNTDG